MAEGVLGIAGGGSSALNQDVIDQLKAAERKATVEPIETKVETWDTESLKMTEIKTANLELIASFNDLTLDNTTNMFEKKAATTTGTAVSYDASDVSGLINGTTSITVTQLAQKDVYQTGVVSDITALVDGGQVDGDMITIEVSGAPIYQSNNTSSDRSTDLVGAGEFTITPNGAGAITITTDATTTWDDLQEMINSDENLTASFVNNRLSVSHTDEETTLSIADTVGSVTTDLGMSRGRKFSTVDQTYEQLAQTINANSKVSASMEQVGDDSYRMVIKSGESGTANTLSISQSGIDLQIDTAQTSKYIVSTTADLEEINSGLGSSSIDISIGVDSYNINTHWQSLDNVRDSINSEAGLQDLVSASIVNNKLVLSSKTGSDGISITQNNIDLGFTSAIVQAQNLQATIDGVAYDVSSNSITTQGSLKITANELGDSSITISQDNGGILPSAQTMVEKYNAFATLIDTELNSTESSISDKSSLRLMKSNIKEMLFTNYGESDNLNLFSIGFSLDTSGHLSIDETEFGKAVSSDFDNLKALFVGTSENKGLATLLKTYTDSLDAMDGLLYQYDDSMTSRKTTLDDDLLKATTALDDKYQLMAEEFSAYGAIIASMEAQFSSLKMMIDQSMATS